MWVTMFHTHLEQNKISFAYCSSLVC
jgi:hypothetical protein